MSTECSKARLKSTEVSAKKGVWIEANVTPWPIFWSHMRHCHLKKPAITWRIILMARRKSFIRIWGLFTVGEGSPSQVFQVWDEEKESSSGEEETWRSVMVLYVGISHNSRVGIEKKKPLRVGEKTTPWLCKEIVVRIDVVSWKTYVNLYSQLPKAMQISPMPIRSNAMQCNKI